MQLGINVTECSRIIQTLEEYAVFTAAISDQLASNVASAIKWARYGFDPTESYIRTLNSIKKWPFLRCNFKGDTTKALNCQDQVN